MTVNKDNKIISNISKFGKIPKAENLAFRPEFLEFLNKSIFKPCLTIYLKIAVSVKISEFLLYSTFSPNARKKAQFNVEGISAGFFRPLWSQVEKPQVLFHFAKLTQSLEKSGQI